MGSNPVYSKSLNSVCTKRNYPTSLLCYNTIISTTKNYFSLQKISTTEIVPPHPPSTTLHMRMPNTATQKKVLHKQRLPVFVGLSLLIGKDIFIYPLHYNTLFGGMYQPTTGLHILIRGFYRVDTQTLTQKIIFKKTLSFSGF